MIIDDYIWIIIGIYNQQNHRKRNITDITVKKIRWLHSIPTFHVVSLVVKVIVVRTVTTTPCNYQPTTGFGLGIT